MLNPFNLSAVCNIKIGDLVASIIVTSAYRKGIVRIEVLY